MANIDKLRFAAGDVGSAEIRLKMQKTMQTHAAVFRTGPVMQEGIQKMNSLWKDMANIKLSDRGMIWNRLVINLIRAIVIFLHLFLHPATLSSPLSCRTAW